MFIKLYERERARARPATSGVWLVMCYFAVLCCPGLLLDPLQPPVCVFYLWSEILFSNLCAKIYHSTPRRGLE